MAERYIPEHRRTQFKARNQFRPDELRRRREEQQVEIRKQKREENLAKRRGIQTRDGGIGVGGGMAAATESDDEASAIESEVRSNILSFAFDKFTPGVLASGSSLADPSCRSLRPALLCFYDAIINMEFFHRPVAMGSTPPTPTMIICDPTTIAYEK